MSLALELDRISKSFSSRSVLSEISFGLEAGSIHALLGSNGAGKSTLVKILSGVENLDSGHITVRSADGGLHGRIGFIHQDLGLVDSMSVADNLFLGRPGITLLPGLLAKRKERRTALDELATVQLDVDPDSTLGELSLGAKTMVAVARMFADHADVIVLDETTAALNRGESEWLLKRIRQFTEAGGAALLVTHRLNEVVAHCDTTTVLTEALSRC